MKTASEEESPKFCIFGAGAIGGMIATPLARSGATVSVVARGQTLAALNRDGVRLVINGEMLQASVQVSEDPSMIGMIRALGSFKMSMLQDMERDNPVELDALLTVTHDIGQLVGVPTPFIDGVLGLARLRATSLGLLAKAA
jgi:ketopantoate reductase